MFSIREVNNMSQVEFMRIIGSVFEHSPWVAENLINLRPFVHLEDMFGKMVVGVTEASHEKKLALLNAHPDLG
ncbi:2-oxo-4-hydroxy-4-carboxy-5-ureidoimidazoline decarboxylase [Anaerobacillus alkalilacustris]|uniref:2-oxo-4-hydroxy-4-carboxy-5-ureidoimidazoline decarboxylase n=1 Tax=Anaerobacillus alkalilacustris TaxID=393763 RepID=UPI001FE02995|nr:2-oxo-4-hydroxy-4-carboxy-5-ureidoimidazoline decarboxylase [Anaerobacillus alkalilacustris]